MDIEEALKLIDDLEDALLVKKEDLAKKRGWKKENPNKRSYYVKNEVLFTDIDAVIANIKSNIAIK